jgi:hypothetical protein
LAGSVAARRALAGARWAEVDGAQPLLGPGILVGMDVVLADAGHFGGLQVLDGDWDLDGLTSRLGFLRVSRPSVVLDRDTRAVMGVFATGATHPAVATAAALLPRAHALLSAHMSENRLRRGIRMFGLRWNPQGYCSEVGRLNMRTGYYCAKSKEHAVQLSRSAGCVVDAASAICRAEAALSPVMAAHRLEHARACRSPGIVPGVPAEACPATAAGFSSGYVSEVHNDRGFRSMSETIVWNPTAVAPGSGWTFAVVDAGVAFDLQADPNAAMAMVPGTVRHGTARARRDHGGIGAVVLNKANLMRPEALGDIDLINWRLAHGACCANPFVPKFSAREDAARCELCARASREHEMLLCDECNDGYHAGCLGLRAVPEGHWVCPICAPLLKRARR